MLAIDVGNTHITSAFVEGEEIRLVKRLPTEVCLKTGSLLDHLGPELVEAARGCVISSVRRQVSELVVRECRQRLGEAPLVVTGQTAMGITSRYRTPATLGTDRLVSAAACHHLYTRGQRPGIVIDMGTATTIDYITRRGIFTGGAIAPGMASAMRGLLSAAPELPEVDITPVDEVIGTTTHECIRSGVIAGHAAMVQGMVSLMARGRRPRPLVVATGGLLPVVDNRLPREYVRDEHLVIRGLAVIYRMHKGAG